jgi:hypothetical protein
VSDFDLEAKGSHPDAGSLESALLSTAHLWLGLVLLAVPDALSCVCNTLLDDERAAQELSSCGGLLLESASRLPPAMSTTRLLQLLSTSPSLAGDPN